VKKQKLRLSITTIQILDGLDRVRAGYVADSEGCNSICVSFCRPDCKPSPFSWAGQWCL
jgi:hypothetical protein